MKECSRCKCEKPTAAFSAAPTGFQAYCKECMVEYRRGNKSRQREYEKKHKTTPEGRRKVKARQVVANAVKRGDLERAAQCEACGAGGAGGAGGAIEAHHDDHNKPLEVKWLCRTCHRKWHRGAKYNIVKKPVIHSIS